MKVLLTGAFGNIGANALKEMVQQGHQVRCFDLATAENRKTAARFGDRVEVVWGDLRNADDVAAAVADREVVIHLAFIIPIDSEVRPDWAREINVGGTRNLLDAMQGASPPPRIILASSSTVLGPTQHLPPPRTADDPVNPTTHYTHHKVECERMVQQSGLDWAILRFGAVPQVKFEFNAMMFYLSPDSRMEFVHTRDVGLAVANAVTCDGVWGKILMIGGGARNQMLYRDYIGRSMEVSGVGRFPDEAFGSIPSSMDWLDTTESQRLLDYQKHNYEDFLKDRIRWLGPKRYYIRLTRPILRRRWLRQSPFWQQAGSETGDAA